MPDALRDQDSAVVKGQYRLRVSGCDDETIVPLALTPDEAAFLEVIAQRITETSEYGCQPVARLEAVPSEGAA